MKINSSLIRFELLLTSCKKAIDDMEQGQKYMIENYGRDGVIYPMPKCYSRAAVNDTKQQNELMKI